MKAFSIFGAPGCGKTTTLMRVISKLKSEGYTPDEIAFVSHTRAAAEEALSRLGIGKSKNVCTLHSMAFNLLGMSTVQVVDHKKIRKFSELINIPITGKRFEEEERSVGDEYMDLIGLSKNKKISFIDAYTQSERPGKMNEFLEFAKGYENWKKSYGYKDFNDMLYDLLAERKFPNVRAMIIDEAQDLSVVQWDIIDMFLKEGNIDRVYIAGDDDQSIMGFSGAKPDGMQQFEERYNCQRHILEKSYRLPRRIHSLCNSVITKVPGRVHKEFDHNGSEGDIRLVNSVWKSGISHGDNVMVLARTHRELRELEDYFIKRKLPYTKTGSLSWYESKYAKAVKVHKKIVGGGVPSENEIRLLDAVGTIIGKRLINSLDFEAYGKSPLSRLVKFPHDKEQYFLTTDFTLTPTIKLSTIHASKGHEADTVVVNTHLPDNIRMNWDKVWEEETRLFYVAFSRSKRHLCVIIHPDGFRFDRQFNQ